MSDKPSATLQRWSVRSQGGNFRICDSDFTHDVELELSGDFATSDQERAFAEMVCAALNGRTVSESAVTEGYPGIAHDFESMRTALQYVLTDYDACGDLLQATLDYARTALKNAAPPEVSAQDASEGLSGADGRCAKTPSAPTGAAFFSVVSAEAEKIDPHVAHYGDLYHRANLPPEPPHVATVRMIVNAWDAGRSFEDCVGILERSSAPSSAALMVEQETDLVRREDVIYLLTHQRNALLESAEKEAPHHADVLRDMAAWWKDATDAIKKLANRVPSALPAAQRTVDEIAAEVLAECREELALADELERETKKVLTLPEDRGDAEYHLLKLFINKLPIVLRALRGLPSATGGKAE